MECVWKEPGYKIKFSQNAENTHSPTSCTLLSILSQLSKLPICLLASSFRDCPSLNGLPSHIAWMNMVLVRLSSSWLRKLFRIENSWEGSSLTIYILAEIAIVNIKLLLMIEHHNSEIGWWGRSFQLEKYSLGSFRFHKLSSQMELCIPLLETPCPAGIIWYFCIHFATVLSTVTSSEIYAPVVELLLFLMAT